MPPGRRSRLRAVSSCVDRQPVPQRAAPCKQHNRLQVSAWEVPAWLEIDRAALGEALEAEDLLDRLGADGRIGGERHHGPLPPALGADGGGDDIDALFAEEGADAADHPGPVGVAEDREVIGERQVEALAPGGNQVGHVAGADAGPGDLDRSVGGLDPNPDQLGEVLGAGIGRCRQLDPALLRHLRRIDEVDRLLGVAGEDPDHDRDPQQAGVMGGDAAAEFGAYLLDGTVAEALGEAAELFAERDEGRQRLHRLRPHRSDVDRVGDDAAGQRRGHLFGGDDAGAVLRLRRRGAEVRRDDNVGAGEDRMLGEGLGGKDVKGRTAELAGLEAGQERVEVDELAAGAVDEAGAVLHRADRVRVDHPDRLRRLRRMEGDQLRPAQQLLDRLSALDTEVAEALGGDELVEGDNLHLEALGAFGDELADAAEADHPQGLAVELGALELGAVPAAGDKRFVRLGDVAEEGEGEGERVLGGGDGVRFRRIGDDDPAPGRGGDVDVVDAGSGAADHLQVLGQLDQLRRHLRRRADQDRVVLGDLLAQLLVGHLEAEVDLELRAQQVDAGVGDLLLDQDLHEATPSTFSTTQSMQAVSASTSSGSTAGNIPIRSWLRPSLRYGSTSTIPFARSAFASAAASTESEKSIVPTTSERFAGSATKGLANSLRPAQP